jgi:orotidine-5'-phosphate decarboxylase
MPARIARNVSPGFAPLSGPPPSTGSGAGKERRDLKSNQPNKQHDVDFKSRYDAILEKRGSRLCVGLDTDPRNLPTAVLQSANPLLAFNQRIIAATHDLCSSYKLNLAFYESYGLRGHAAIVGTLDALPKEAISIGDAKRGDIGNTAERYAATMLELYGFDAVTVNPYMGMDTLKPFFEYPGRCVFVLALTSNPGSSDFQRLDVGGRPLYREVIDRSLDTYGSTGSLGFVVGATHPEELAAIRETVGPDIPLLIPGIGAQGGDAARGLEANNGGIAFFNVSRGIAAAGKGDDFQEKAREAAQLFSSQLTDNVTSAGEG